jgi:hypothetical protein
MLKLLRNTTLSSSSLKAHLPLNVPSGYHATSQGIKHVQTYTNKPWIINSGATNHMTGASNLFASYIPCSGKDKVRVADGSMVPITGHGSIWCTKTLSLSPFLHVPDFPINLLSVSSIIKISQL